LIEIGDGHGSDLERTAGGPDLVRRGPAPSVKNGLLRFCRDRAAAQGVVGHVTLQHDQTRAERGQRIDLFGFWIF
jgi:hypothetical protein